MIVALAIVLLAFVASAAWTIRQGMIASALATIDVKERAAKLRELGIESTPIAVTAPAAGATRVTLGPGPIRIVA